MSSGAAPSVRKLEATIPAAIAATDFDEKAITLSVVADATTVAAGDILAWDETVAGDGLASPGGKVQVEISRS